VGWRASARVAISSSSGRHPYRLRPRAPPDSRCLRARQCRVHRSADRELRARSAPPSARDVHYRSGALLQMRPRRAREAAKNFRAKPSIQSASRSCANSPRFVAPALSIRMWAVRAKSTSARADSGRRRSSAMARPDLVSLSVSSSSARSRAQSTTCAGKRGMAACMIELKWRRFSTRRKTAVPSIDVTPDYRN
jgi:hypothetical protein